MRAPIDRHQQFTAAQLVDSALATTRAFWRCKAGFPQFARDPRPLAECVAAANDPAFETAMSALRDALNDE